MRRFFDMEGPLFTFLSRLADLLWLNLLYVVCCIPVVTIGASTTALYYVSLKMAKDEEGYITKSFFKSFKENFKQATVIWLIFAFIIGVLVTDLVLANGGSLDGIFNSNTMSKVVIVAVGVVGILIVLTLTYVFPILARFDNTIKNTIKNSLLISIRHLPYSLLLIVINVLPVVLIFFFPTLLLAIFIVFSLVAYVCSKIFNKIFKNYMPAEEVVNEDEGSFEMIEAEAEEIKSDSVNSSEGINEQE